MTDITLTAADGFELGAWLAEPQGAPRGGIVVVQEIFGVNSHIRSICDRLAEAGYRALAPAVFDRIEPDFQTGYTPDEVARARGMIPLFDMGKCLLDVAAARDHLAGAGKTGIVGFCLGGSVAYGAASQMEGFAGASSFYGGMVNKLIAQPPRCPVQFHYGAEDTGIPPENYEAVRAAVPEAEFYVYEGAGHGFNCDQRASYDAPSAALAWQRTLDFFGRTLG